MALKFLKTVSVVLLGVLVMPLTIFAQVMYQPVVDPNFNPDKLIDDTVFTDTQTFGGAAGIQKFLEIKNSPLANTNPDFLVKFKEPGITMLKQALEDPEPNLGRLRTAAELIWDASQQSGLNPQVIIVTLNKEQGLITGQFNSDSELQRALDHAMGFACPDSGGCGSLFPGFYYQLFGNLDSDGNRYLGAAKSLMKSYSTAGGRGPQVNGAVAKVGDTVSINNTQGPPYNAPASQPVTFLNNATAALYRYTPHVFNGNYNFWKFFNEWFRYPNGTLLTAAGDTATYIIQNGTKQLVPGFVATARALNMANKVTVSPTEFDSYPTDKPFSPSDNTIIKTPDTKQYVFENGEKHPVSSFVLTQRGLDPYMALTVTADEANLYATGTVLPPNDGTIIRGQQNQAVYLVDKGEIKLFSAATFAQRKITGKQITLVPDDEIATYAQNGFVPPLDGTLVKSATSSAVYLVSSGLKQPLTAELFKNNGYSFKNVLALASDEVDALPTGPFAPPKDKTFFAADSKSGQQYEFKEGTIHSISPFVVKQRGITPDYVFGSDIVAGWPEGIPIPPKDSTIVKGDGDATVFLVSGGQLKPMTYQAYLNRKITPKKISVLPQSEVDAYAKGDVVEK